MAECCDWIAPNWRVPAGIRAVTTLRNGGYSQQPFDGLNLGDHVGDDPVAVMRNRQRLCQALNLPSEPAWLTQIHSAKVVDADVVTNGYEADAISSCIPGRVCAVLTADCLPLLLCNQTGDCVAAVHAGWRGLAAGVIEATLDQFADPGSDIMAWLGPAIGAECFEVGVGVRDSFMQHNPEAEAAFKPSRAGHWLADIYGLARQRLEACGVTSVWGGEYCTVTDKARFYSYRRDGQTGRMATLIWIDL